MTFPADWGRKVSLDVDDAQVGGSSGTLTDYLVLITHASFGAATELFDADGSFPALNGGGDLRFTADEAGTVLLPCLVLHFVTDNDPANGRAAIIVLRDVAKAVDTAIWCWYNAAGKSQPARDSAGDSDGFLGSENCFPTASGPKWMGFWDCADGATQATDRTANDRHMSTLTGTPTFAAAGPTAAPAIDLDAGDYLGAGAQTAFNGLTELSMFGSVDMDAVAADRAILSRRAIGAGGNSQGAELFVDDVGAASGRTNTVNFGVQSSSASAAIEGATNAIATGGGYQHVLGTFLGGDAAGLNLYIGGALDANAPVSTSSVADTGTATAATRLYIGASGTTVARTGNGLQIGFVGACNSVLDADWALTWKNALADPASFITEGTPQNAVAAGMAKGGLALLGVGA